jgi:hypothetical protein
VTFVEAEDGVSPATAPRLKIIAFAMGGGLTMMAGFVFWSYLSAAARVPTPHDVKFINTATTVAMVVALLAIIASEIAWRSLLRKSPGPLGGRVHIAFIVRLACREGASLLGLTIAYLAACNGVLRVYPAYWVNLAPFVLFLGFLATHWPSAERLTAEACDVVGENPSF